MQKDVLHPSIGLNRHQRPVLAQIEKSRHFLGALPHSADVPCVISPEKRRRTVVELPHERDDLLSINHVRQPSKHCPPRDRIAGPDPVNRQQSGILIRAGECLHNVCCAPPFPPSWRESGWFPRSANCLAMGRATNLRNASQTTMPLTPPSAFCYAVILPTLTAIKIFSGIRPRAK